MPSRKDLSIKQKAHIIESLARWMKDYSKEEDHRPNKLECQIKLTPDDNVVITHWAWEEGECVRIQTLYTMPLQEEDTP